MCVCEWERVHRVCACEWERVHRVHACVGSFMRLLCEPIYIKVDVFHSGCCDPLPWEDGPCVSGVSNILSLTCLIL